MDLRKIDAQASRKLLVRGIPTAITAKELRHIFQAFGAVTSCDVLPGSEGEGSTAVVLFERQYCMETALVHMDGFKVAGAALRVQRAEGLLGRSWALAMAPDRRKF